MELEEVLRRLEEELFERTVRQDGARLSELLAEDFQEFGSSGRVFTRAEIVAELRGETERTISLREFQARLVADKVVLVTYRATRVEAKRPEVETRRSSLWVMRDGRWQIVFHQGTLAS